MGTVVGLDVHSKDIVFYAKDQEGKMVCKGQVETTIKGMHELRDLYQIPAGSKIGMESGTQAFFVARHLEKLGYVPVIIHAQEVQKKKARPKQKDDMRDAKEICNGLQSGMYQQLVHVPTAKYQKLRSLLSSRRHFVNSRSNEVRSAKHAIRSAGLKHIYGRAMSTSVSWAKLIQRLDDAEEPELARQLEGHFAVWQVNHDQVEKLNKKIKELLAEHPEVKEDIERLKTVPGIGEVVALSIVAILAESKRFKTAKQASSYAGLVTETNHSADKKKYGHITKEGSPELRAMLVEAAQHANKPHNALNPFFRKICAKRGYKVAVVACAHRLCRIAYAILRDKKEYNATKVKPTKKPVAKTRSYVLQMV